MQFKAQREQYLQTTRLCLHLLCNVHTFSQGFNTETKLVTMIGQPGGVLAGGSLPDRLHCSSNVDCFELPANAPGGVAAR